jgi:hypothetical protein
MQSGTVAMAYSFKRNRIINGNMLIDQRNAGAATTPSTTSANVYLVDCWATYITQASKLTFQQNAGAITPPCWFFKLPGVTTASAYSVTSSDIFFLRQAIEGLNTAGLRLGNIVSKDSNFIVLGL